MVVQLLVEDRPAAGRRQPARPSRWQLPAPAAVSSGHLRAPRRRAPSSAAIASERVVGVLERVRLVRRRGRPASAASSMNSCASRAGHVRDRAQRCARARAARSRSTGSSLMWMPARLDGAAGPHGLRARPARARRRARTRRRGHTVPGGSSVGVADPRRRPARARARGGASPRVITTTSQPQCCSTCSARCADAPKPEQRDALTRLRPRRAAARGTRSRPRTAAARPRDRRAPSGSCDREVLGHRERVGVPAVDGPPGEVGGFAEVLLAPHGRTRRRRRCGATTARRPGRRARRRSHPSPSASTVPTTWWPGMTGRRGSSRSPSTTCRSVRQHPHAVHRAPAPRPDAGSGTGRSTSVERSGRDRRRRGQHLRAHHGDGPRLTGRRRSPRP